MRGAKYIKKDAYKIYILAAVICTHDPMMFRKMTCSDNVVKVSIVLLPSTAWPLRSCVRILFVFLCCPIRWIGSSSNGALPNVTEQDFETGKWAALGSSGLWRSRDTWVDVLNYVQSEKYVVQLADCGSQWPRCVRRGSATVCLLCLRVRIPPGAWMFICC